MDVGLSQDIFADRLLITGPNGAPRRQLADTEMTALWLSVDKRCGFRPEKDFFFDVITNTARANCFHPVCDYLAGLRWDGVARLSRWLITYGGAENNAYTRAVGRLVLVAAARRVRQPGCKF